MGLCLAQFRLRLDVNDHDFSRNWCREETNCCSKILQNARERLMLKNLSRRSCFIRLPWRSNNTCSRLEIIPEGLQDKTEEERTALGRHELFYLQIYLLPAVHLPRRALVLLYGRERKNYWLTLLLTFLVPVFWQGSDALFCRKQLSPCWLALF